MITAERAPRPITFVPGRSGKVLSPNVRVDVRLPSGDRNVCSSGRSSATAWWACVSTSSDDADVFLHRNFMHTRSLCVEAKSSGRLREILGEALDYGAASVSVESLSSNLRKVSDTEPRRIVSPLRSSTGELISVPRTNVPFLLPKSSIMA